jgi:membrane associated rhomboid family serine protease
VRQNTSFKSSFAWGIAGGLALATLFSAFVGLMALWRGSDWNPTYRVSTWSVVRGYCLAGLLGGLAFGVLQPVFWGRIGGLMLGVLLGPLVYGAHLARRP